MNVGRRALVAALLLSLAACASNKTSPDVGAPDGGDVDAATDAGAAYGGPAPTGPTVQETVTVDPTMSAGSVPARFVGLSYEKSHLTDGFFTSNNAPLVAMFKLLGPSVVRIGGNSVDATTWDAAAVPTEDGGLGSTIGTADVDALSDFLYATGWKTIYAVGLKHSTPAAAATEAQYVATKLGDALLGFEIGNEIDLYGLSTTQLFANWQGEADAIRQAVPGAIFTGPATAADNLVPPFAHAEASLVTLLTQHYYRGDGQAASSTMAELLAPDPALVPVLVTMGTADSANGIDGGYRLDECNSFYNHGAAGVSDAFGSALWVLDFLFANAAKGSTGVNLHGGGAGQDGPTPFLYTPIAELDGVVTGAQPIFHGMLLFTLAGAGTLHTTTVQAGGLALTAYSVAHADGSTAVVLVNKDPTTTAQLSVDVGASVTSATAVYLQGASLTAKTGVTVGGVAVSPSGAWSPNAPWTLPVAGHVLTVNVPQASAVLVQATP
jgi:hypothetical protein